MVATKVVVKRPFEDEKVADFEVGQEGIEYISFSNGKLILRSEIDGMKVSRSIPVGEYEVTTFSDGEPIPEKYRRQSKTQKNGNTQKAGGYGAFG